MPSLRHAPRRDRRRRCDGAAGGATVLMPDALLDEVTALVEWPAVYAGTFDAAFLAVPQECLILTMQQNQKYFALADADGTLLPTLPARVEPRRRRDPARDRPRQRARAARAPRRRAVLLRPGPPARRSRRACRSCAASSITTSSARRPSASSGCVRSRARSRRSSAPTPRSPSAPRCSPRPTSSPTWSASFPSCRARWAATTRSTTASPPTSPTRSRSTTGRASPAMRCPDAPVAQAVALADKLESLAGMFGIGQVPTGDKDPFGLRRAALGVLRILVERASPRPLRAARRPRVRRVRRASRRDARRATRCSTSSTSACAATCATQGYTAQRGRRRASTARRPESIADLPQRLAAVRAFEALPEAQALAAANKRIVNILRKARRPTASGPTAVDHGAARRRAPSRTCTRRSTRSARVVDAHFARGDYTAALVALRERPRRGRPLLRRRDGDGRRPALRANRLALLRGVAATMNRVADIGSSRSDAPALRRRHG